MIETGAVRIAVVIPTRNRPELAMAAVRSLLDQDCEIDIFVADNSSSSDLLQDFCRGQEGVHYLRPESELSMPENWDFAVRRAMEISPASHFSVHYDRKFSKPGSWGRLAELAGQWPDDLLTFSADFITAQPPPLRVWQTPWTGSALSIETKRVAGLLAGGKVGVISPALPIFSNCLVPRPILEGIVRKFGNLCNSTGPDSCFMWRFLALHERYIHIDQPQGIFYASHRSNGLGYLTGRGGDFPDFLRTFGDRPWLDAAPLPGINLGQNMLYHEHELVRRETGDRLPPLDRAAILDDLNDSLRWIDDPRLKEDLRGRLRAQGWSGSDPEPWPKYRLNSLFWQYVSLWRLKWQKEEPPHICGFRYRNDEQALRAALRYPRQPEAELTHLALLEPVPIGARAQGRS